MTIRLVLIDVDGTLVGRSGIHVTTPPALNAARVDGVRLGLSTGRLGAGVSEEYARLVDPNGLHVFQSGAVVSGPGQDAIYRTVLPPSSVRQLVSAARLSRHAIELYSEREIWVEEPTPLVRLHCEHLGVEPLRDNLLSLNRLSSPIVSAVWVVPATEWSGLHTLIRGIPRILVTTATTPWAPGVLFVNITRQGTSKASALRWLAGHYGIRLSQIAMIGDDHNDIDAMAAAGLAIAMADAPLAVREAAQATVAVTDEGGVAEALAIVAQHH